MKFHFITIFPELVLPYFEGSILARAIKNNLFSIACVDPRKFSNDKHNKVDEYMIGGGAGLLMRPEPIIDALASLKEQKGHVIALSPAGKKFTNNDAKRLAKFENISFICGRYEGFDERVVEIAVNEVFSIGDFVLTGGELGALCLADAISRHISGVLGNENSLEIESFEDGLLEAPSFTKPNIYKNFSIISAFLKGNHAKITALKNQMALCKTRYFRPDLYAKLQKEKK